MAAPTSHSAAYSRSSAWFFGVMGGLLLLLFIAHIALGSVAIPFRQVVRIVFWDSPDHPAWEQIIWWIRLPRAIAAVLAGAGLAVGGLLMQTLFRNPLAGPSVLGISAGASLGVAAVMLLGAGGGIFAVGQLGSWGSGLIIGAASVGAGGVMVLILLIANRIRDQVTLLIVGLMIGNITIAIVSLWQYFSAPDQIRDYLIWTFGSLGGVSGAQLGIMAAVIVVGLLLAAGCAKSLNTLLLGEDYARSMGTNVKRARMGIIISTSLMAASVTAFCGPIGFVGVAVPHLARAVLGESNHRTLLPATLLCGAALMLGCDIIAQVPGSSTTLPISAITSLVGSPVVIWVIIRNRQWGQAF